MSLSKELTVKAGVLSVWGSLSSYDPIVPPLHNVYVYYTVYLFTQGRVGGGELTREKVRGAIVHKAGRKYQHYWLYLQSINFIKHQLRRHLGFGVFIVI
jgi:hypothetical protein